MRFNAVYILILLLINTSFLHIAHAADKEQRLRNLSERLITLRGEVDDLNNRFNQDREQHSQTMRGLASRKHSLESRIEQEELNIDKLRESLEINRKRALEAGADASILKPILLAVTEQFKAHIRQGLPFKKTERLGVIADYEAKLQADVLSPQKAANQLWSYMEDEIRMSRENGIFRQTIQLDGAEKLVDVARLGMVLMYFRTGDERYGLFEKQDGQWVASRVDDSHGEDQIQELFSALEKQVRTGYFELPNPL